MVFSRSCSREKSYEFYECMAQQVDVSRFRGCQEQLKFLNGQQVGYKYDLLLLHLLYLAVKLSSSAASLDSVSGTSPSITI